MRKFYHGNSRATTRPTLGRTQLRKLGLALMLSTLSPWARGENLLGRRWLGVLAKASPPCVESYAKFFKTPVLLPRTAERIASLLCADDRIFANFAWAQEVESPSSTQLSLAEVEDLGEIHFAAKHYSPLIIGLSGANSAQIEAILMGLREARHAGSEHIFRWRNDEAAFTRWLRQLKGGVMPGVIHVHVDTSQSRHDQVKAAQNLLWSTFSRHSQSNARFTWDFSEYTILITSDDDLSAWIHPVGDPIRWLSVQKDGCESELL